MSVNFGDGTQGGQGAGASGAGTGGQVDWNSFAQQLPEDFRADPTKLLTAYRDYESKVKDLQQYYDFYHKQYEPWRTANADKFQKWLESQQGQGQPPRPGGDRRTAWGRARR